MTRKSPITVVVTALLALAYAGLLFVVMGAGRENSQLFGIPTGHQTPPKPGADWWQALAAACRERGLSDVEQDFWETKLEYTMAPRRSYYRTELTGMRESERVKVRVVLTAPDQGAWVVTEWREE